MSDSKLFDHKSKNSFGDVFYYDEDDELHRENGPAVVKSSGTKYWYKHGKCHREDGPAVVHHDGTIQWYKDDKLHRKDGPASIWHDGTKQWFKHGKLHREDGPAIVYSNGIEKYYLEDEEVSKGEVMSDEKGYDYKKEDKFGNVRYYDKDGNRHREDGPAVVFSSGTKKCYKHGNLHREDGPAVVYHDGSKYWYKHGKCHREDGPAVVYSNGSKYWYKHGERHREDGPAIIWSDGTKKWFKDGELHREDGPAEVYPDGEGKYYLEGKEVSKEKVMGDEKGYDHKEEDKYGNIFYYDENHKRHREDGPAVIWHDGTKKWYKDGKYHREDGPAIVYNSGTKKWYKHGKYHREDGPAIIWADGTTVWYKDGELHREDGPAVVYDDGTKKYYLDGEEVSKEEVMGDEKGYDHKEENGFGTVRYYDKDGNLHREDGPAVVYDNGSKFWYKHGERHREGGPAIVYDDGTKYWYKHGKLHREDGPAIVKENGSKFWYKDGELHREDGPAIIWSDGTKKWFKDNKLHREDGPAEVYPDGEGKYYLEGKEVSKEEVMGSEKGYDYKEENEFGTVRYYDEDGNLHREDGPAIIESIGRKEWYKHGNLHREDGPAVVYDSGTKYWYKHGKLHREDGPAVVSNDGAKAYYLEGKEVSKEEVMGDDKGKGYDHKEEDEYNYSNRHEKKDYIYMNIAKEVSKLSTCDRASVGAVCVKNDRVVGVGFNGAPSGFDHCDEDDHFMVEGHCRNVCHAEQNLVSFVDRKDLKGSNIYGTHFPCMICFNMLVNSGVKSIFYLEKYGKQKVHDRIEKKCKEHNIFLKQMK